MKGALIFLAGFFLMGYLTTTNTAIPPGMSLYGLLNVPILDYPVLGMPVTTLTVSVLNGVVYGLAVYLIYSLLSRRGHKEEVKQQVFVKKVFEEPS